MVWFTIGLWLLFFLINVGASYDERQVGGFRSNTVALYAGTTMAGIAMCGLLHASFARRWQQPTRADIAFLVLVFSSVVFYHSLFEALAWVNLTTFPGEFWPAMWWMAVVYIWVYTTWVLGASRIHASVELRRERARVVEAEAAAQRATIAALQLQLNPHFLFNALNTISSLVMSNRTERAEATIGKLSQLLRLTLETGQLQFVDLDKELQLVRAYLDIESERYSDRMNASIAREPGLGLAMIPPILLQPLVENAVKHAVQRSDRLVNIELTATRRDDSLVLQVSNDGSPSEEASPGFGIGLENIRRRLDALYGSAASLTILTPADGGFTARLVLPYRSLGISG